IIVHPLPTVGASPDTSICAADRLILAGFGGMKYTWHPPLHPEDPKPANPVANPTHTITYQLLATDNNGCLNNDTIRIEVRPVPVVSIIQDQEICEEGSIELWANGGSRYSWTPDYSLNCSDCPNPVAMPDTTTTYTVVATNN